MAISEKNTNDNKLFPLEIIFERDNHSIKYKNISEFSQWKAKEQEFWTQYVNNNDNWVSPFRDNVSFLRNQNEQNEQVFRQSFPGFVKNYLPSECNF